MMQVRSKVMLLLLKRLSDLPIPPGRGAAAVNKKSHAAVPAGNLGDLAYDPEQGRFDPVTDFVERAQELFLVIGVEVVGFIRGTILEQGTAT